LELKITGKNTQIAESLRVFTERKISKLAKLTKKELRATVTMSEQTSKKSTKSCRVEVILDAQRMIRRIFMWLLIQSPRNFVVS